MLWLPIALAVTCSASAGVRVVFSDSNHTTNANGQVQRAQWTRTIEIDGARFRIINANGLTETSTDNGATTVFSSDPHKVQTPLRSKTEGAIHASIEHEKLTIGSPQPGPTIAGIATHTYTVDYSYVTVAHVFGITNTTPATEHYVIAAADIDASPAAVRVLLSRGFGNALAYHAEAFQGFPLRIDGHLVQGEPGRGFTADFRLEAVTVEPSTWSANP